MGKQAGLGRGNFTLETRSPEPEPVPEAEGEAGSEEEPRSSMERIYASALPEAGPLTPEGRKVQATEAISLALSRAENAFAAAAKDVGEEPGSAGSCRVYPGGLCWFVLGGCTGKLGVSMGVR